MRQKDLDTSDKTVLEGSRKLESHGSGNLIVFDEQRLPDVRRWNAEHPELYTLLLELKDAGGIEKHRLRIFDLHKVTEDNQMCGAADRQEFRDSLDQTQK